MHGILHYTLKQGASQSILVYLPLKILAADTESAANVPLGIESTGVAHTDVAKASYYSQDDTSDTAITLTNAGVAVGTFVDSGWIEVDATNLPGWYQVGLPDTMLAASTVSFWHVLGLSFAATEPTCNVQVMISVLRSLAGR